MKLPRSAYNLLTYLGTIIASTSMLFIIFMFVVSIFYKDDNPYMGLFIYIIFPAIMVFGLLLIPIGMLFKMRKIRKKEPTIPKLPYIDLNNKQHRNATAIFVISTLFILFLSGIGTYETFHYSESVEFCGTLCHEVMEPEYVAYQHSSHARIKCVECHVGEGASWYVKSKMEGMHQVYAVLTNNFNRPIETPIRNLRPASETCEKCHWPQKFYPRKLATTKHFLADSMNTEWVTMLQMKLGPQFSAEGLKEGIHWHINPDIEVEFISENDKREAIGWVKYTNKQTGETHTYKDTVNPITDSLLKSGVKRKMECIDCHNRPSHKYQSPPVFIDHAMIAGEIPKEIPFIKKQIMEILKNPFTNKDTAMMTIKDGLTNFYKNDMPDYYAKNKTLVDKAIQGTQLAYSHNVFPAMKVFYDKYPDHIGHKETNGCFRCHNNTMVSDKGRVISKDCNICHTIIAQGPMNKLEKTAVTDTLPFKHPIDIEDAWKEGNCADCHQYLY